MELKRYNIKSKAVFTAVSEHPDGDYVLHADAQAALAEKDRRIEQLEKALRTTRLYVPTATIGDRLLHRSFDAALAPQSAEGTDGV